MALPRRGGIALFERSDIPDSADPSRTYLTRWWLLRTPFGSILLHKILLPDRDRHLHDHPWPFVSIVLKGGYEEERSGARLVRRGLFSIARRRATDLHRIRRLFRVPTWTLLFVGGRARRWGFQTPSGWIDHDTYFAMNAPPRVVPSGHLWRHGAVPGPEKEGSNP